MSLTYSSFVSEIAALTVISSNILVNGDNNSGPIMPAIIDYLEGRIYRELDLPVVSIVDTTVSCSSGVRVISLSTGQGEILVITTLNLLTSAGATSSFATRIPLMPASQAVVDTIYPSAASSNTGQPAYFTRLGNTQLVLGPTPDQAYGTEVIGTIRPAPLSASNSSTWLTQNFPEGMIAAGMIFATGYMRDFGAQSDNPQMSQSWENQYQALMKSMTVDASRMKFESQGWTSQQPQTQTPPRT